MTCVRRNRRPSRPAYGAAAVALALAVALAGCSDDSAREVQAGRASTTPSSPSSAPGGAPGSAVGGGTTSTEPPSATDPAGPAGPSPDPTGAPGSSPPSSPVTSPDPGPPTTVPGDRRQPHRWEGYTVGADGATLTFTYYAGVEPCSTFDSITADESAPGSVRVTIYERPGPEGTVCIMLAQLKSASVTLGSPLGGRVVVDGAA